LLIVLEGIDGSGKSTLARVLAQALRDSALDVLETREPWTSAPGIELRRLLSQTDRTTTPEQELELFQADRQEHVRERVQPALDAGAWVVQDRTFYSTAAYQGAVGLEVEQILEQSRRIAPEPDLVLWLALAPKTALQRVGSRGAATNFEQLDNLEKVDAIYQQIADHQDNFMRVDATPALAEVQQAMLEACRLRLGQPHRKSDA